MRLKKIITIVGLILIMFSLTHCSGQKDGERTDNFRTGSQGLEMRFLPNQPPAQIYDDQELAIQLEVSNKGAETVGGGEDKIYLSGFDKSILPGIVLNGETLEEMEGKTRYNPIGNMQYITFSSEVAPLKSAGIDRYPLTLLATACYGYTTTASANVCIDPNPHGPSQRETVCTPQPVGLGTQGAPIAVSNIDVQSSPRRTRFQITIQNVGGGDVFKEGANYLARCSPYDSGGLQYDDVDYVKLLEVSLPGGAQDITASCKPISKDDQHIRLINGQATITCEADTSGAAAYVAPLVVKLSYGYRQTMTKQVTITSS